MGFRGDRISHKNGWLWKPSFPYHYQPDRSASRASSPGPGATGNSRQMGQIRFAPIPLMKLTHCNWHRHTGNLISSCCYSRAFWPPQLRHLFRVNSSTYWWSWSTARGLRRRLRRVEAVGKPLFQIQPNHKIMPVAHGEKGMLSFIFLCNYL